MQKKFSMVHVTFRFYFVKLTFHKAEDLKNKNMRESSSSSIKRVLLNFIILYGICRQRGKEENIEWEQKKSKSQCFKCEIWKTQDFWKFSGFEMLNLGQVYPVPALWLVSGSWESCSYRFGLNAGLGNSILQFQMSAGQALGCVQWSVILEMD